MRNKRTFIGVALLIAVLMLGVGYAAVTSRSLKITGDATASPDDTNFVVVFDENVDPVTDGDGTTTAGIISGSEATINVSGLTTVGQTATATYTIKNGSNGIGADLAATSSVSGTNADFFTVTQEFAESSIGAGESTTITVSVKLEKTPVDGNKTATVNVNLTATAKNN